MSGPRIAAFAYSAVGHACVKALIEAGAAPVLVVTHEDDPGETRWFPSVAELARAHGIATETAEIAQGRAVEQALQAAAPDLILSFYYRRMIPMRLLRTARLGAFNMHGSLLPKYRGRAPVNWAVLHGESRTGVTLHEMVGRADAGRIVDAEAVPIDPDETAYEVMQKLVPAAVSVLTRQLPALLAGTPPLQVQDEAQATTFGGRGPEDGRIDWHRPATAVHDLVRAVAPPFPGAFSDVPAGDGADDGGGRRLMIWKSIRPAQRELLPVEGAPGLVLSTTPFRVVTGGGILEVADWSWADDGDPRPPAAGTVLPSGRPAAPARADAG